jgi:hypothetical protein
MAWKSSHSSAFRKKCLYRISWKFDTPFSRWYYVVDSRTDGRTWFPHKVVSVLLRKQRLILFWSVPLNSYSAGKMLPATLCYVTLCYVTSCCVALRCVVCCVVSCRVVSCRVAPCHVMSCHILLCCVVLRYVTFVILSYVMLRLLYYVMLRYITLFYVMLRYVMLKLEYVL